MMSVSFFRKFYLALILSFVSVCFSQNRMTDSLEHLLKTAKEDTNQVKILDDLCWEYTLTKSKKSGEYAKQMLELAQKINYQKGIGNAYANIGAANYMQSNNDSAIKYFSMAAELRKKMNDKAGTGGALNNIAMAYQQQSSYTIAVSYYLQALKIFEEINDVKRMAQANVNISSIYTELKNYDLSIKYGMKGLEGWKQLNFKFGMSGAYVNIGNAYKGLNKYKEAIEYYEKALELQKELNSHFSMGRIYHNLGSIYYMLKKYDKAEEYIKKEIPLKEEVGDLEGMSSAYCSLGNLLSKTGKPDQAIAEFKKSLGLARSIKSLDNVKWSYLGLREAYALKGNAPEVSNYAVLYDQVKDSLLNEANSRIVTEMQTQYETEKKEKENEELRRKSEVQALEIKNTEEKTKNQLILAMSLFLMAGASSAFLFNRRKLKQKAIHAAEMAEEEKKRFRAIIEAEERERSRIAQELHDGLGQMLSTARLNVAGLEDSIIEEDREWLEKSLKIIDDACIEVRHISHNMMPSALIRLGIMPAIYDLVDNVNASKSLKVNLNTNVIGSLGRSLDITIYRIIQEVLNNMIKHSKADQINLDINRENEMLRIGIKDNGVGFDVSMLKESKGMGWKNIFSRVSMMDGDIDVNSQPLQGTIVFIQLKLKNA
jgi:signal transduction histidine kinase/TPR repeat protein